MGVDRTSIVWTPGRTQVHATFNVRGIGSIGQYLIAQPSTALRITTGVQIKTHMDREGTGDICNAGTHLAFPSESLWNIPCHALEVR